VELQFTSYQNIAESEFKQRSFLVSEVPQKDV